MKDILKTKLGALENALEALFELAEHGARNKDADALVDVLKDIQEVTIEIDLLKSILKRDIFNN